MPTLHSGINHQLERNLMERIDYLASACGMSLLVSKAAKWIFLRDLI